MQWRLLSIALLVAAMMVGCDVEDDDKPNAPGGPGQPVPQPQVAQ